MSLILIIMTHQRKVYTAVSCNLCHASCYPPVHCTVVGHYSVVAHLNAATHSVHTSYYDDGTRCAGLATDK